VVEVIGNTLATAGFGVAAFAQPAIGRAYLSGHMAEAVVLNNDVYGPALFATLLPALLLITIGNVLFGVAVVRSGSLPKLAGIGFALGGTMFTVLGILFSNFLQPLGAALMTASAVWIAITGWRVLGSIYSGATAS
jgi:hypothetical protein